MSDTVRRLVTVKPGMCGYNSLFVGQIGDWTWETVTDLCGTNAFDARNADGAPTYLSFYYYHLHGGPAAHLYRFSFGDRIEVLSRAYGFGSESVLVLHRIRYADGQDGTFDAEEFYDRPRGDCLYVENFNRWISRGRPGTNMGLVTSAPVDFRHEHLPELPGRYSPRLVYGRARATGTFHDEPGWHRHTEAFEVVYPVDASRDLNGVGLLYFASYFSIIDGALLKLWRHLGRDGRSFLDRVVLDQKLCYLGNADHDAVLRLTLDAWRGPEPDQEVIDVTMTDGGRPLAVCTLRIQGRGHVP